MCCGSVICALFCLGACALYIVILSGLLYFAWNKVIVFHTKPKLKQGTFVQALILITFLCFLVAPLCGKRLGCRGGGVSGGCPYAQQQAVKATK